VLVLLLLLIDNEVEGDADDEVDEVDDDDDDGEDTLDEELIAGLVVVFALALLLGTPALDRRSTFNFCCCWSSCC